jgi:hypothetical protein
MFLPAIFLPVSFPLKQPGRKINGRKIFPIVNRKCHSCQSDRGLIAQGLPHELITVAKGYSVKKSRCRQTGSRSFRFNEKRKWAASTATKMV